MDAGLLVASLAFAAVFAVAGVAKLADREGSRAAAAGFGVPRRLAGLVALAVPIVELAIAAGLMIAATRVWAAAAALALLGIFSAAIGVAMVRGQAPDCHCFGQLHSEPAGWKALARNAVLAAVGAFVVAAGSDDPGPGAFSWLDDLEGLQWAVLALAVAFSGLAFFGSLVVLHVLRSYGRVLTRLERVEEQLRAAGLDVGDAEEMPELGLPPGTPAPAFSLQTLDGERVSLDDLRAPAVPLLLVFTSPTCVQCSVLMPRVAEWQRSHADAVTVAVLSGGQERAIREETEGLEHVLLDSELAVYESYDVNGTPSAVLVGDDGSVAAWTAAGSEWIETLFEQAVGGLGRTPGLPVGAEAPAPIAELVRGPTAVLFWRDDCGFCESIEADVLARIEAPPPGAPALVVVSAGDTGLPATVVPDPDWELSGAMGADGTPMAVLLDADGRVASPLAAGAPAVLELLGIPEPVEAR